MLSDSFTSCLAILSLYAAIRTISLYLRTLIPQHDYQLNFLST